MPWPSAYQELSRYAKLAYRSFATRFSGQYVDNLMRQAGTVDDMKALAQYVHSTCRARIEPRIARYGQSPDDGGGSAGA